MTDTKAQTNTNTFEMLNKTKCRVYDGEKEHTGKQLTPHI